MVTSWNVPWYQVSLSQPVLSVAAMLYPALADDKLLSFSLLQHKETPKTIAFTHRQGYLDFYTFQHTQIAGWLSFWLARHLPSYLLGCLQCNTDTVNSFFSSLKQMKFTIESCSVAAYWRHRLRRASLLSRHISWRRHGYLTNNKVIFNQQPNFVQIF